MLVISRRAGQSIWIGDDIEIQVVEVAANRVKLGITAPRNVPVLRDEIKLTGETNRAAARAFSTQALGVIIERFRRR
jgi:carbon storage regulator